MTFLVDDHAESLDDRRPLRDLAAEQLVELRRRGGGDADHGKALFEGAVDAFAAALAEISTFRFRP